MKQQIEFFNIFNTSLRYGKTHELNPKMIYILRFLRDQKLLNYNINNNNIVNIYDLKFNKIKIISKPSRPIIFNYKSLLDDNNSYILSTSYGLLSVSEAIKAQTGGLILARIK